MTNLQDTQVTVSVGKTAELAFGGLVGKPTWNLNATATVSWSKTLVTAQVPPYAVGLCQWIRAGLNTEVTLNGQINGFNGPIKSKFDPPGHPTWAKLSDIESDPDGFASCEGPGAVNPPPPGVAVAGVRTLKSGLWFSAAPGCNSAISAGKTTLHIDDVVCAGPRNTEQADKYLVNVGDLIPMAIYAPIANFWNSGICTTGPGDFLNCPGYSGAKPEFPLKIVGFAPFKVSNFNLDGVCPGGVCTMNQGFKGKFLDSATRIPGGSYEDSPNIFGAVLAELIK